MKQTITLDEKEVQAAVKEYLQKRGHKNVSNVRVTQSGISDSSDPREYSYIQATAESEPKKL